MASSPKRYVIVVQCHVVKQRCSGYYCEKAFHERTGGFADLPADPPARMLAITCGGCSGKRVIRLLHNARKNLAANEKIAPEEILVRLASCVTRDNYHSPRCPHAEQLRRYVEWVGLDLAEDTSISETAQRRRREGRYGSGGGETVERTATNSQD